MCSLAACGVEPCGKNDCVICINKFVGFVLRSLFHLSVLCLVSIHKWPHLPVESEQLVCCMCYLDACILFCLSSFLTGKLSGPQIYSAYPRF
ncbi:hypothetical protein CDAR_305071 [Caerostris darwini]|uniref:Uncharacterized protein n=1 Tax=Caerostris darwini TaxID=1538125 RepID=A0AAV4T170_9ARAC|nr:hypothetical protein CDAR_305071 [Caerostris darwini]